MMKNFNVVSAFGIIPGKAAAQREAVLSGCFVCHDNTYWAGINGFPECVRHCFVATLIVRLGLIGRRRIVS